MVRSVIRRLSGTNSASARRGAARATILPEEGDVGFFDWAAPWVRRYGERFTADDAATIAGWLRPAVAEGGQVLDVGGGAGHLARLLGRKPDTSLARVPWEEGVRTARKAIDAISQSQAM
jgi:hypothetical protein